ncbi:hypothetical protein SKAU_G00167570, partial [Synaphobranchus kaupii]
MDRIYNSTERSLYLTSSWPGVSVYRETATMRGDQWPEHMGGTDNDSFLYAGSTLTGRNGTLDRPVQYDPLGGHTMWQVVLIVFFSCLLSLVTIVGNILVLVAFKVNKQLKTVNNYFLLSLAFADLIIGVISMNLYTAYIIMDQWAMGTWACDLWLAIDYVASNASVMNLLVISFDRYFSVTRPLTYRAKRTTKRAGVMIGLAWSVSLVLWAPAILFWQYFVGERKVPPDKCYVQFLSEPIITFCTAIAAFYLPVTIMSVLYWRIYKETQNRSRELAGLQASGRENKAPQFMTGSARSCGSCDAGGQQGLGSSVRRAGAAVGRFPFWLAERARMPGGEEADRSNCDSWNNNDTVTCMDQSGSSDEEEIPETRAIFSIVLNLPGIKPPGMPMGMAVASRLASSDELDACEEEPLRGRDRAGVENDGYHQRFPSEVEATPTVQAPEMAGEVCSPTSKSAPMSLKDAALARRFAARTRTQITKRKRMSLVKEKKAAQTLSAILFAFIITWTPYNIMVLVNTFCNGCIPD